MFGQATCIRISLVQTDACNIISQSIFTGISLQPLHYSIQRGKQSSSMTSGTLMESYSVTVTKKPQRGAYSYDVPLREAWFSSGALGGIATSLCSPFEPLSHSDTTAGISASAMTSLLHILLLTKYQSVMGLK